MKIKRRIFGGCNAKSINPQLYSSFKEALAMDNVESLVHKKDIKFMKDACDLYDNKKSRSVLHDLCSYVSGHVDLS